MTNCLMVIIRILDLNMNKRKTMNLMKIIIFMILNKENISKKLNLKKINKNLNKK